MWRSFYIVQAEHLNRRLPRSSPSASLWSEIGEGEEAGKGSTCGVQINWRPKIGESGGMGRKPTMQHGDMCRLRRIKTKAELFFLLELGFIGDVELGERSAAPCHCCNLEARKSECFKLFVVGKKCSIGLLVAALKKMINEHARRYMWCTMQTVDDLLPPLSKKPGPQPRRHEDGTAALDATCVCFAVRKDRQAL